MILANSRSFFLVDKINEEIQNNCQHKLTTNMADFYLNYRTGKHFQKITSFDLKKTYAKIQEIPCPSYRQEIQRVCLLKLFIKGNKLDATKKFLDNYIDIVRYLY